MNKRVIENQNQIKWTACELKLNQIESLWSGIKSNWASWKKKIKKIKSLWIVFKPRACKTDSNQTESLWIRIETDIFWPLSDKRPLQKHFYDGLKKVQDIIKWAQIKMLIFQSYGTAFSPHLTQTISQWQTCFIKVRRMTGTRPSFWWNEVFLDLLTVQLLTLSLQSGKRRSG